MSDPAPSSELPTYDVGVIGAGVAGLTAARALAESGRSVVLLDKGRTPGGRASSRKLSDGHAFDLGAQYFTVRHDAFMRQVQSWLEAEIVALWQPRLALTEGGEVREAPEPEVDRYVGTPRMDAVTDALADDLKRLGVNIRCEQRVSPLKRNGELWRLTTDEGEPLAECQSVLVAVPPEQAAEILAPSPILSNAAKSVEVSACWAAMVEFAEALPVPFDAAFVNHDTTPDVLGWVARDSSKPGRQPGEGDRWILHAAPQWSDALLAISEQEALSGLIAAFSALVGTPLPEPRHTDVRLWRYARPVEPLTDRALEDAERSLYAAGDWFGGPRIEGAYLSGLAAAELILGG